jgi:hypothetical protein
VATPIKKTPELIERVLSRIAMGETLAAIARDLDFHPVTWSQWVAADETLNIAHQRARAVGADVIADDILAIIDQEPEMITGEGAAPRRDSGYVAWQKARAETRLKLLAKWHPTKYGDKQQVEHSGPGGAPIQIANTAGVATAAVRELRQLRLKTGELPPPDGTDLL